MIEPYQPFNHRSVIPHSPAWVIDTWWDPIQVLWPFWASENPERQLSGHRWFTEWKLQCLLWRHETPLPSRSWVERWIYFRRYERQWPPKPSPAPYRGYIVSYSIFRNDAELRLEKKGIRIFLQKPQMYQILRFVSWQEIVVHFPCETFWHPITCSRSNENSDPRMFFEPSRDLLITNWGP